MKNKKRIGFPLVMLGALVLTSCGGSGYRTFPVTGDYMAGKTAKGVYNAYASSAPTTLNPTLSQNVENVTHLANFISTLVMNDNYGILRRELASKATRSDDYKTFTFTVRDDVPWVQSDGTIYKYKEKEQYVTADDFVTTAKLILDYNNQSEIYYMYTLFVNNAWEYYLYTMMQKFIVDQKPGYKELKGDKVAQAKKLTELVQEYSGHEPDTPITSDSLDKIGNFERVGVKAENNVITYTLREPAQFFPTMLTYTPFMPTNSHFYATSGKASGYGTSKDKLLYCGPFRLTEFSANKLVYTKNDKYFNADKVHLDTVNYKVVDATTSYKDMREAFDKSEVDGFSLNKKDEVGWKKYITGEDGTGTIQNPASDVVNSRELDDIDYTYHFNLNPNRSTDAASWQNATYWDETLKGLYPTDQDKINCVTNTNNALKIKEVRKLILDGISFEVYNKQFTVEDPNQYQINTFTPRGYVFDANSKDYTEYYYEAYKDKKGITLDEAKSLLKPQQISGVEYVEPSADTEQWLAKYPWLNLKTMRTNAISAAQQFKDDSGNGLQFPVIIDYMGTGGISAETLADETELITSWNERANCCTINQSHVTSELPLCSTLGAKEGHYPYFEMVDDKITNSTTWSNAANNGYYTIGTWGWIGDYADPLTYLHCYVTNGEMSKMSGNTIEMPSYSLDESGVLVKSEHHMLYDYNNIVNEASKLVDLNQRYSKFAEAEYMLLNDLYIMKPCYMTSQGWVASVSRALGYENPSSHYGLADRLLTGIWVLDKEVPTGAERQACRDLQAQKKAAELEKYGGNTIEPIYKD